MPADRTKTGDAKATPEHEHQGGRSTERIATARVIDAGLIAAWAPGSRASARGSLAARFGVAAKLHLRLVDSVFNHRSGRVDRDFVCDHNAAYRENRSFQHPHIGNLNLGNLHLR
jgi:hypothetical protein